MNLNEIERLAKMSLGKATIYENTNVQRKDVIDWQETVLKMIDRIRAADALASSCEGAARYYEQSRLCENNCSPEVGFHEPECCIQKEFTSAYEKYRQLSEVGDGLED